MSNDEVLANRQGRQKVEPLRNIKCNLKDRIENKDIKNLNLQIKMIENQNEWRKRTHMDDYWN